MFPERTQLHHLHHVLLRMSPRWATPVTSEAVDRLQVGLGRGMNHVRVSSLPNEYSLGSLVQHANRNFTESINACRDAARERSGERRNRGSR